MQQALHPRFHLQGHFARTCAGLPCASQAQTQLSLPMVFAPFRFVSSRPLGFVHAVLLYARKFAS